MGQRDRTGADVDSFARKAGDKPLEYDAGGPTPAASPDIGGGDAAAGVDFDLGMGGGGSAAAGGLRAGGRALSLSAEGGGEDEEEVQSLQGGSGGEDRLVEPTARGDEPVDMKVDYNGAQVDMVTGQVISGAAPATGGELGGAGGLAHEGGGDGEGAQGPGVQSMGVGLAPAGAVVGEADPEDGEDPGVQSMGASGDAALAMGSADAFGADTLATPQLGTDMTPGGDVDDAFGPPPGEG